MPNWADFQHYSDRNPPWIKLHRELQDKPEWRRLSGAAAKLLIDVWILAAQPKKGGYVTLRLHDLAYRLRVPVPRLSSSLLELRDAELLALSDNMLAECQQVAPQRRGETETEGETQRLTTKSVATPP